MSEITFLFFCTWSFAFLVVSGCFHSVIMMWWSMVFKRFSHPTFWDSTPPKLISFSVFNTFISFSKCCLHHFCKYIRSPSSHLWQQWDCLSLLTVTFLCAVCFFIILFPFDWVLLCHLKYIKHTFTWTFPTFLPAHNHICHILIFAN